MRTGRKWSAEQEVVRAELVLRHRNIVGAVQTGRLGLGVNSFKPFSTSTDKERRDAVVAEVRRQEQEKGRLHLVKCAQQGQCLVWQEAVVERKLSWIELLGWEPARARFLIKSTYDVLPSAANLVRWKITEDDKCRCGQYGTLRHTLPGVPTGAEGRKVHM